MLLWRRKRLAAKPGSAKLPRWMPGKKSAWKKCWGRERIRSRWWRKRPNCRRWRARRFERQWPGIRGQWSVKTGALEILTRAGRLARVEVYTIKFWRFLANEHYYGEHFCGTSERASGENRSTYDGLQASPD